MHIVPKLVALHLFVFFFFFYLFIPKESFFFYLSKAMQVEYKLMTRQSSTYSGLELKPVSATLNW